MSEVKGSIKVIGQTVQITEKFSKRQLVVTTEGTYPQEIELQLTMDKCSLGDNLRVGQEITAHFNLRGKGYTDKTGLARWQNTLDVWKIE